MKVLGAEQLSSEWFQAHCGCVSGSYMAAVLDFSKERTLKNGDKRGGISSSKRETYKRMKLAELLTGIAIQDNYVSREMLDGIEREPAGRAAYELQEGVLVEEVGFALHDSIPRFGGSVDGLVGDDGMIELKCPKPGTHVAWILAKCIPEQHLPQIRAYLCITGRAWCDFVTYCPLMKVPELRLMVVRFERSAIDDQLIELAVNRFNGELDQHIGELREMVGHFELPAAEAMKFAAEGGNAGDFTADENEYLGITDEEIRGIDPSWTGGL